METKKREDQDPAGCIEDNSKKGQAYHPGIRIDIDCTSLDEAIEKANRLVKTLKEAERIAKALSGEEQKRGSGLHQVCQCEFIDCCKEE